MDDDLMYISSHLRKASQITDSGFASPESFPFLLFKLVPIYGVLFISHNNLYVHTMLISLIIKVIVPKPSELELKNRLISSCIYAL